jgi:phosphatidylserine decarboxylase
MSVPDVTPDLPPGRWRALLAVLAHVPHGTLSRAFGRVADLPLPRALRPVVLGGFARALGIDTTEAERPVVEYESVNRFFVRRLRPGVRTWPTDPALAAAPVDGVLGQLGAITDGTLVQAKGRRYTAAALLADEAAAAAYDGGAFLTLYLSPRHYHRIHTPCPGTIPLARHIPGALLPVNAAAVAHVPELFARNERLVCYVDGDGSRAGLGRVAVVAVGAFNVGRISAAFDPAWNAPAGRAAWVTNRRRAVAETHRYQPPVPVALGQEIMAFHLGSTVVLLFPPGVALEAGLAPGQEVRVGQVVARP